uniref:F-box domain-containing protein n=1 Tax=Rhabditophanes sp. KR3021 TaxID=114890 RepID=A0AC35THL2_9BILA
MQSPESVQFLDLPIELIEQILFLTDVPDIIKVRLTCKKFNDIVVSNVRRMKSILIKEIFIHPQEASENSYQIYCQFKMYEEGKKSRMVDKYFPSVEYFFKKLEVMSFKDHYFGLIRVLFKTPTPILQQIFDCLKIWPASKRVQLNDVTPITEMTNEKLENILRMNIPMTDCLKLQMNIRLIDLIELPLEQLPIFKNCNKSISIFSHYQTIDINADVIHKLAKTKLFENIEIGINQELVTAKISELCFAFIHLIFKQKIKTFTLQCYNSKYTLYEVEKIKRRLITWLTYVEIPTFSSEISTRLDFKLENEDTIVLSIIFKRICICLST